MIRHTVQAGETLSRIAASYGVDVRDVIAANPQKARVELASGAQVFQSLAAGEDIELPGVLGFGSSPNAFGSSPFGGGGGGWAGGAGGFQGRPLSDIFKVPGGEAKPPPACPIEGDYYDAIKQMCVPCPKGEYYDAIKQMCVPHAKIDFNTWGGVVEEKQQLLKAQEDAARAEKEAQEATAKAAEATAKRNKMLIGAGVVGVVLLGVGGAVWAFKKK
jgi:hypothetical protein